MNNPKIHYVKDFLNIYVLRYCITYFTTTHFIDCMLLHCIYLSFKYISSKYNACFKYPYMTEFKIGLHF